MFKKNHYETFTCDRCGKNESIYTGPHGMILRAMLTGIPGWITVILQDDQGYNQDFSFCSVKCTRKWLKKNAKV